MDQGNDRERDAVLLSIFVIRHQILRRKIHGLSNNIFFGLISRMGENRDFFKKVETWTIANSQC
jgi:hypothetical protein